MRRRQSPVCSIDKVITSLNARERVLATRTVGIIAVAYCPESPANTIVSGELSANSITSGTMRIGAGARRGRVDT